MVADTCEGGCAYCAKSESRIPEVCAVIVGVDGKEELVLLPSGAM